MQHCASGPAAEEGGAGQDTRPSDDAALTPGGKLRELSASLSGKLAALKVGGDAGGTDQNGGGEGGGRRTPLRQSFSGKMQRLLNISKAGNGSAGDAPSSPGPAAARPLPSLMTRSLDMAANGAAGGGSAGGDGSGGGEPDAPGGASAPGTPVGGQSRRGSKSLWGKLGSGIKVRKPASAATLAARSSFEAGGAVELPVPAGIGGGHARGGCDASGRRSGLSAGCSGSRTGGGAESDEDSFHSPTARPGSSGGCYEETLDLRHAITKGYPVEDLCPSPSALPAGMEDMPDYLMTPGMQEILGGEEDGPAFALASPEAPAPDLAAAAAAAAAIAARTAAQGGHGAPPAAPAGADADATIALLPAGVGFMGDATVALFPAAPAMEEVPEDEENAAAPAAAAPSFAAPLAPAASTQPAAAHEVQSPDSAAASPAASPAAALATGPSSPVAAAPAADDAASPASILRLSEEPMPVLPLGEPPSSRPVGSRRTVRESIPLFVAGGAAAASVEGAPGSSGDGEETFSASAADDKREVDAFLAGEAPAAPTVVAPGGGKMGGGPQRVAPGGVVCVGGGSFVSRLETVEEAPHGAGASEDLESPSTADKAMAASTALLGSICSTPTSLQNPSTATPAAAPASPAAAPASPAAAPPSPLQASGIAAAACATPSPATIAVPAGPAGTMPAAPGVTFAEAASPDSTPTMAVGGGPGPGAAHSGGMAASPFFTPDGKQPSPRAAEAKAAAVAAAVAAARGEGGVAFGSPASGFESPLAAAPGAGALAARGRGSSPTMALCGVGIADATLSTLSGPEMLARMGASGTAGSSGIALGTALAADAPGQAVTAEPTTPATHPLDKGAASPSAVYHAKLAGTPFVQAAAANLDAARNAPLVDSSPFDLSDMDTMIFREDLDKVCMNLAHSPAAPPRAAAGAGAATAPAAEKRPAGVGSPGGGGGGGSGVEDALIAAQLRIMTQKAAGFERQLRQAQAESEQLKEQLATLEFEKTELGQQDEFEREARLYAEGQLADAGRELAAARQALAGKEQLLMDVRNELQLVSSARAVAEARWKQERGDVQGKVQQAMSERDAALDRLNFQDMRLTALGGANAELQAALAAETARVEAAQRAAAAKDQDIARLTQELTESRAQTEKALEQVCSANMATEQAAARAAGDRAALDDALAKLAAAAGDGAERERTAQQLQHYALLKQKYAQKSAALKEAQTRLAAKEAECSELMGMCDQLLAQQEAARVGGGGDCGGAAGGALGSRDPQ